jgi:hypothetical protein
LRLRSRTPPTQPSCAGRARPWLCMRWGNGVDHSKRGGPWGVGRRVAERESRLPSCAVGLWSRDCRRHSYVASVPAFLSPCPALQRGMPWSLSPELETLGPDTLGGTVDGRFMGAHHRIIKVTHTHARSGLCQYCSSRTCDMKHLLSVSAGRDRGLRHCAGAGRV